ncbi:MAG TPA: DUF2723 domain-containing protein, partial [bacterium]
MLIPAFLFLFTFFFYLLTHCASFNIADSGETILACSQLDIGHSPSYPLHALWGRVNCLLPLGQPMLRVTFSSIITGAGSTVILYLVLKIIFKEIFYANKTTQPVPVEKKPPRWILEIPALFGALTFGFSSEQWFQACGAKGGIYTLNTLFSLCVFLILFKMREKGCFIKSFFLTTYIFCLSLANHWENQVVMAPAYLWFFFSSQRRIPFENILKSILRPFDFFTNIANIASALGIHNIIRGITFGLLSLSVYLYLPLRASRNP